MAKSKTKTAAAAPAAQEISAPVAEPQTTQAAQPATEEKKAQVALFGQIGFETVAQFDEYIAKMKQNDYNNILLTINVALRSVSQRGGFSLEENEAVSVALRHLNGAFTVADQPTEAPAE